MRPALISPHSVAAIVLAAGASQRLGTPKQLARLGSETLLQRTVRVALEADLQPVIAVLAPGLSIEPAPFGMMPVINHDAAEGMASSIRAGVQALQQQSPGASGAIVIAVDQPAVTAAHLRALALGADHSLASFYSGRKGIPAYFPRELFATLLALRGDLGARALLQNSSALPLPGGELDIDTMHDLEQAQKLYPI